MSSDAHASEVRVMRQLWRKAEHERALLADKVGCLDSYTMLNATDSPSKTMNIGSFLSMLEAKKQRVAQVAVSVEPFDVPVLNTELLSICDEICEAAARVPNSTKGADAGLSRHTATSA